MPKLKANDVLMEVNMGTTLAPNWKVVACVTSNGLDSASDEINADSKCGIDRIPGEVSWTGSIEAFYELVPGTTQISGQDLINIRQNGTYYDWRMRNAAQTYYRGFNAYLSGYTEDLPYNDIVKLTAEMTVKGALILTAPTT